MEIPDYKTLKSKVADREYELPSHKERKEQEREILKLDEDDLAVYELVKDFARSRSEEGEAVTLDPDELANGNNISERGILSSLEKLYKNGKIWKKFEEEELVYESWDVSVYN